MPISGYPKQCRLPILAALPAFAACEVFGSSSHAQQRWPRLADRPDGSGSRTLTRPGESRCRLNRQHQVNWPIQQIACHIPQSSRGNGILDIMSRDPSQPKSEATDEAWHEIDDLIEEIVGLSKSELPAAEFYTGLLDRVVSGLAASGGVVWTRAPGGNLHAEYQINLADTRLAETGDGQGRHRQLLELVLQAGKARLVPPHSGPAGDDQAANPTEFLLVLCPWKVDDDLAGVVEVFQRPGTSPKAQRGYLRFLAVICELAADFHRNRQLRGFRERMAQWRRFQEFTERVHGGLDLRATAYQIANEGRRLIGCDRVSVAVKRGSTCTLLAISGVDTLNRRANVVRQLERLSKAVAAIDEPLWHPEESAELPAAIEEPLHAYLDEAHVRSLAVVPLKASDTDQRPGQPEVVGVLVAEQFYAGLDDDFRGSVAAALGHSALALQNALEFQNVPLVGLLRVLGKARWFVRARQLPKTMLALLAVVAVVVALVKVPADFEIEARGELQPLLRREVFAPSDGVVSELRARHAKRVRARDVLVVLRKPELDFEFKRVWGELQTARKRLAAVEAERLQNPRDSANDRQRYNQLTAEEEELKELINSLERQYEVVRDQQSELQVSSPIDGEVLTWNLKQLLEARPVGRGQMLMSVADLKGPWVLELRVPDDRIAYVLDAQEEFGQNLDVSFVVAADPAVTYRGQIEKTAIRTEITESDESVVLVTASINRDEISKLIPAASVVARIRCGQRPIGYVWLHDLFEAVRSWIMF